MPSPPPTRPLAPAAAPLDADLASVRTLARWLDRVPLDPLLGFVAPGVGDVLGSVIGLYIVAVAVRRKLPPIVIARMLLNLAGDAVIGIVPLLGDLGDWAFKANQRNAELLLARAPARRSTARDWAIVAGAALALIAAVVLAAWAAVALARWIF